jgi:glycosyltransferase involved in cell wall biosynthesis
MIELSVVLPCLNEAQTLGYCIETIQKTLNLHQIKGEIILADNGSTDQSIEIARQYGIQIVIEATKGYGATLQNGIKHAVGAYVIIGDSDKSYDFGELVTILTALRQGNQLVIGNRFKGQISPNAMPWLHQYVGNPVLSTIARLLFNIPLGDFHCGLRGFSRNAYLGWDVKSKGMEFASELIICAKLARANIAEVPVNLYPDGRNRAPHLNTWRDGFRHLRLIISKKFL